MSLLSRLLGKAPPTPDKPVESKPEAAVETPPRRDPAARAREEEASLSQAIAERDMAAVARWVLEGSSTRIRQQAASEITDPGQLRDLIRATRHGNDKTVHRILTTKRDELLAEARRAEQLQADLEAAASAIARHCERPCDASYATILDQLEARWRTLAPQATPERQQEVAKHLERAREVIERHRQSLAAEAERQRAAALAAEEARRQRELDEQAAAAAAAEQARLREAEREAERAKRAAEDAAVRELVGLLKQAQAALEYGGTARAARLRETITEKLPAAPALPAWFERQLQQVDARIEELKGWKTFTVEPKRAELLERMQSLIGAEMAPEELARHIRRLRDEWRTLKRGAGEDPSPEWQQFEEAAERAYEPCREHFARQAEQRKQNQARREELLDRLATFAEQQSVETPDWRAIQQVLFEARREWREYAPVDQAVIKELQARFHALLEGLQARLDAEYASNVQAKRDLIAQTAALLQLDDTRRAIEEAKNLQRAWRTVGLVPRHQDNALWEEFRGHCDAVFARSAQESAAYGASLEANQARAIALCEELERIAGPTGEASPPDQPALDTLREEFDSLELPRAVARDLRQRFARAADRCMEAVCRQRAAAARRGWNDLLAAAAQVHAYALAVARAEPSADYDALRIAAATAVAGLEHAPKDARAALERRLERIAAGEVSTDLPANEAALRLLCVRAELIVDAPTPTDDLDLRREYQMQRLVASMARGERVTRAELDDLVLEWLAAEPTEPAVYEALRARFEGCRESR